MQILCTAYRVSVKISSTKNALFEDNGCRRMQFHALVFLLTGKVVARYFALPLQLPAHTSCQLGGWRRDGVPGQSSPSVLGLAWKKRKGGGRPHDNTHSTNSLGNWLWLWQQWCLLQSPRHQINASLETHYKSPGSKKRVWMLCWPNIIFKSGQNNRSIINNTS